MFEALQRIGWQGSYLLYGHQQTQDELARLKAGNLYAFGGNTLFLENLPIHAEIANLVKGQTTHPAHYMELVGDLADTVTVLDFGQRIASGPPDAVLRDPRVIEAYLGRAASREQGAE